MFSQDEQENPDQIIDAEHWLVDVIEALTDEPEVLIFSALATVAAAGIFLVALTRTIGKAGTFQPPLVVALVVLGLVAMISVLAVIIRPGTEVLGVAVGAAVGSLASTLGIIASNRKYNGENLPEAPDNPAPLVLEEPEGGGHGEPGDLRDDQ